MVRFLCAILLILQAIASNQSPHWLKKRGFGNDFVLQGQTSQIFINRTIYNVHWQKVKGTKPFNDALPFNPVVAMFHKIETSCESLHKCDYTIYNRLRQIKLQVFGNFGASPQRNVLAKAISQMYEELTSLDCKHGKSHNILGMYKFRIDKCTLVSPRFLYVSLDENPSFKKRAHIKVTLSGRGKDEYYNNCRVSHFSARKIQQRIKKEADRLNALFWNVLCRTARK